MMGTRLAESVIVKLGGCYPSRVVLHDRGEGTYERYAVHTEAIPEPEKDRPAFLVYGHYTDDLVEAVREFGQRSLRDVRRAEREQEVAA